jgi:hypothetical protein
MELTSFAAESEAGNGTGSRLAGTAVHSQSPVDSVAAQQVSAATFGAQQVAAVQQQLAVVSAAIFAGEQQAATSPVPQPTHAHAAPRGGKTTREIIARLKMSQRANRLCRKNFMSLLSQNSRNGQSIEFAGNSFSPATNHRQKMHFAAGLQFRSKTLPCEAMIDRNLQSREQVAPLTQTCPNAGKLRFQLFDGVADVCRTDFNRGESTSEGSQLRGNEDGRHFSMYRSRFASFARNVNASRKPTLPFAQLLPNLRR